MRKPELDAANGTSDVQKNAERWNILVKEKALAKMAQQRMLENQARVQEWHEEQAQIMAQIAQMQPSVSKLLENAISSSNSVIENYVLQFARELIEVFNLISDSYSYHIKIVELYDNADYWDAVLNYREICLSIIDCLAPFGVEEISTPPGGQFNGRIHDVEENAGSPTESAFILESIRAGFKYKGEIIQKEKVRVSNELFMAI